MGLALVGFRRRGFVGRGDRLPGFDSVHDPVGARYTSLCAIKEQASGVILGKRTRRVLDGMRYGWWRSKGQFLLWP